MPQCELSTTLSAVSGTWVTSNGTFNSTSTTTSIATIDSYIPESLDGPPLTQICGEFWYRARMLNQRNDSNTRVGIVYHYQGPGTFYEVSFSPAGSVFISEMTNGVSRTVATGTYSDGGQNQWFDVELRWTAAETIVRVNGVPVVRGVQQNGRTRGLVGLITRQTTAKFDRLLVMQEYGDPGVPRELQRRPAAMGRDQGQLECRQRRVPELSGSVRQHRSAADFSWEWTPGRRRSGSRCVHACSTPMALAGIAWASWRMHGKTVRYDEIVFGADGIARVNPCLPRRPTAANDRDTA